MARSLYNQWIADPMKKFMSNSSMSGIILISAAAIAIVLTNSPFSESFERIWQTKIGVIFGSFSLVKDLHHWINDGLMAVFFFVVGLELKREIIAGELNSPRKALLPIAAAAGGMLFPAAIYLAFNHPSSITGNGWGIPMATDIAFALGILYLLGDRVPVSLKVFLTALAIADDLGAVLVIAFFYTSDINMISLITGAGFMIVLIVGNVIGVRSTIFYGLVGIGGLWLAFLMSGVHATIAAVLAAFTIPARVNIPDVIYYKRMLQFIDKFKAAKTNDKPIVTAEQYQVLNKIENLTSEATTPLQKLEHSMHGLVAFVIMPIFALSNAGVEISRESIGDLWNSVTIGISAGLLGGKFIGIAGMVALLYILKISPLPQGCNRYHILGVAFLAGIGFTMSLFITELAFEDPLFIRRAKLGILFTSVLAGIIGYLLIRFAGKKSLN